MALALKTRKLQKSYGTTKVLHDIDIEMEAGPKIVISRWFSNLTRFTQRCRWPRILALE